MHELLAEESPPPAYTATRAESAQPPTSLTVPSGSLGVASPRGKRKSEIRSLLDATTTVADDHKPQWMVFHSHAGTASGIDNMGYR